MDGGRRNNNQHGHGHSRCGQDFLMAAVMKRAIFGRRTSASSKRHSKKLLKRLKSQLGYADQKLFSSRQFAEGSNKYEEFFCYNEHEEEEEEVEVTQPKSKG